MPEPFVNLLCEIVLVAYAACIMLGLSFISSKLGKKRYSTLFNLIGVILLIAIILMFYVGTSKLCEASIGDVQGYLNLSLEEKTVLMRSTWGFGTGFYLIIISAILAMISFFSEIKIFLLSKRNSNNRKA